MAVRLNKALKELNVGINTVAEFLQKKGLALEDAAPTLRSRMNSTTCSWVPSEQIRISMTKRKWI